MLIQLTIGSVTILMTTAIVVAIIGGAIRLLQRIGDQIADQVLRTHQFFIIVSSAVLIVLTANVICVWIWAGLFLVLGVFPTLEEATYFSIVSFTTVGYGDVVVDKGWRILSGFVSINGLLAFGILTAFIVEVFREFSRRYLR